MATSIPADLTATAIKINTLQGVADGDQATVSKEELERAWAMRDRRAADTTFFDAFGHPHTAAGARLFTAVEVQQLGQLRQLLKRSNQTKLALPVAAPTAPPAPSDITGLERNALVSDCYDFSLRMRNTFDRGHTTFKTDAALFAAQRDARNDLIALRSRVQRLLAGKSGDNATRVREAWTKMLCDNADSMGISPGFWSDTTRHLFPLSDVNGGFTLLADYLLDGDQRDGASIEKEMARMLRETRRFTWSLVSTMGSLSREDARDSVTDALREFRRMVDYVQYSLPAPLLQHLRSLYDSEVETLRTKMLSRRGWFAADVTVLTNSEAAELSWK
jgi:hypothetical protein